MRTKTVAAVFKVLDIDHETLGFSALAMLNDEIKRVWPDAERFSLHSIETAPEDYSAYRMAKDGKPFWDILGEGRIAVYCVEGSEGYWIHVGVIGSKDRIRNILTLKTYGDLEEAQGITNLTQFLLGG